MKTKLILIGLLLLILGFSLAFIPRYLSPSIASGRYENQDNLLTLIINEDQSYKLIPGVTSMSYSGLIKKEGLRLVLISNGNDDSLIKEGEVIAEFEILLDNTLKAKQSSLVLMQELLNTRIKRKE
jgi:hypothetical protein